MTGSAVPASATFDPDGSGPMPATNSGMMERPAIDFEITADDGDLITAAEAQTKAGVTTEVEFMEHGCWDGSTFDANCASPTHVRTTDMSRAEFLYSDSPDAEARAAQLETPRTMADYGIGALPTAKISTVNDDDSIDVDSNNFGDTTILVEQGSPIELVADLSVNPVGSFTYNWKCNDTAGEILTGSTLSKTFNKNGIWTLELSVLNAEGRIDQYFQKVGVVQPAATTSVAATSNGVGVAQTVTFSGLPQHDELYIVWGDGQKTRVYDSAASIGVDHTFRAYSKYYDGSAYNYKLSVIVYNAGVRVETQQDTITIN